MTVPPNTVQQVLVSSRRRCCICFGLNRDFSIKSGQIAHLDGDNSNNNLDNLAFLCFDHHDRYDSRTSQSKNFTIHEIKAYRDELYRGVLPLLEKQSQPVVPSDLPPLTSAAQGHEKHKTDEQKTVLVEILSSTDSINSTTSLAHKLALTRLMVERLLYELTNQGTVRIDRQKGTTRKTYSLVASIQNRLIDTFLTALEDTVVADNRHIRHRQYELDALVETASGITYAVEIMLAQERISKEAVERRIRMLAKAKSVLRLETATGVLIIGIAEETLRDQVDLKQLEHQGIIVRYVDVGQPAQLCGAVDTLGCATDL